MDQDLWTRFFRDMTGDDQLQIRLKMMDVFTGLTEREVKSFEKYAYFRKFKRGEIIIREGDPGVCIYLVIKGNAVVYKTFHDKKVKLSELEKGALFGELAILGDKKRSATVEANNDAELLCFYREDIMNIIRRYPELGIKIISKFLDIIADRFVRTFSSIETIKSASEEPEKKRNKNKKEA